jgi:hypothetical protein
MACCNGMEIIPSFPSSPSRKASSSSLDLAFISSIVMSLLFITGMLGGLICGGRRFNSMFLSIRPISGISIVLLRFSMI